ncbi:hypothetical protein ACGFNX_31320 [Streptomyces sp. NPDC048723]|uniref:hypothetical protein n=1 Tax=Streptomyces sp. NPDC048723 TaxID=3365589 RepID=UPI003713FB2F
MDTSYQVGFVVQAGAMMLSPKVEPSGSFWVTAMTSASSGERSCAKPSWNVSCLIHR